MSRQVWRVFFHGVTDGRDSGYPTLEPVGPLFARKQDAQEEADRMLARTPERRRMTRVMQVNPATGTYSGGLVEERPTYEALPVQVLDREQAAARRQEFIDTARQHAQERAERLEAEAAALRAEVGA